jgi:hypothetical protein
MGRSAVAAVGGCSSKTAATTAVVFSVCAGEVVLGLLRLLILRPGRLVCICLSACLCSRSALHVCSVQQPGLGGVEAQHRGPPQQLQGRKAAVHSSFVFWPT